VLVLVVDDEPDRRPHPIVHGKSAYVTATAHKPIDAIAYSYRKTRNPRAYEWGRSTTRVVVTVQTVLTVTVLTVTVLTVTVFGECWRRQTECEDN
jgi:hypothetical protein